MNKEKTYKVYKIYYDDELVYIGRTKQPLQDRMRNHFFKKPMIRELNINKVSKIEYAEVVSEADMFVYELYYICLFKPPINKGEKPCDNLSLILPPLTFHSWTTPLWDKWKKEINEKDVDYMRKKHKKEKMEEKIREKKREALDKYKIGEISDNEYWEICNELQIEKLRFLYENGEITFEKYKKEMGFLEAEEMTEFNNTE